MLERLREALDPLLGALGRGLAKIGLPPTFWSVSGLALSILAGYLYSSQVEGYGAWAGLVVLLAGGMDLLDGAAARGLKRVSQRGAFLDSFFDRLVEVIIYTGLLLGNRAEDWALLLALATSLLVSYTRARGEALGIKVAGMGIGERAERLLLLAAFSLFGRVRLGVYAVLIVAMVTLIERSWRIARALQD